MPSLPGPVEQRADLGRGRRALHAAPDGGWTRSAALRARGRSPRREARAAGRAARARRATRRSVRGSCRGLPPSSAPSAQARVRSWRPTPGDGAAACCAARCVEPSRARRVRGRLRGAGRTAARAQTVPPAIRRRAARRASRSPAFRFSAATPSRSVSMPRLASASASGCAWRRAGPLRSATVR